MPRILRLRRTLTGTVRLLARLLGSRLKARDGSTLDRAFILPSRKGLSLVGISPHSCLRPVGVAQPEITYWKQELCWEKSGPPDFSRLKESTAAGGPAKVCHAVISHLGPESNQALLAEWSKLDPESIILLVHGGAESDFRSMPPGLNAIHISDTRLKTKDHGKEKQEYHEVIRGVATWLLGHPEITHVHLAEYDCVPLVRNLGQRLVQLLEAENADLAGCRLHDYSGTIHPHYLNFLADAVLTDFVRELSFREDKSRVLSMIGCTSVWSIACFREVAGLFPPSRIYLEMAFPTLAHHLGWRVRPYPPAQEESISFQDDLWCAADRYREMGSWMLHPCKQRWRQH